MQCLSCQAPMPDGASFCGSCGTRAGDEPTCPSCPACGVRTAPDVRYCAACGVEVQPATSSSQKSLPVPHPVAPERPVNPEALARYASELKGFVTGGVLVQDALDALAQLRRERGVTAAQHAALIEELDCFEGVPLALALDPESAYLVERQPTTLIMAAQNLCRSARDLIRSLDIQYRCSTSGRLHSSSLSMLGPEKQRSFAVPLDPPECAGQYQLEGYLCASFHSGAVFRGRFQLPALRAAAQVKSHAGPSHVSINVDAHNAAMVKGIGQLASNPTSQGFGEVRSASGRWEPLEITAASEIELDRWLAWRPGTGSSPSSSPRILGEPLPCRGVMLRVKRESTRAPGGDLRDVWLLREDQVTFGRDDTRADLRLAVEPFDPPEQYPQNVQQSYRISGRHLAFQRADAGASVTDLGSSNGTVLDGQRLRPNQPQPLGQRGTLRVADALGIEATAIQGDGGVVHALHLQRTDNVPQRSYLLASGGVGLWPDDYKLLGPRQRGGQAAPLLLLWQVGGPCVRNVGLPGVTLNGERLGVGQMAALDHRDIVRLGGGWVIAVMEILQERYRGR